MDLLEAHRALDMAVEAAYEVDFNGDEEKIVAHLFKLYAGTIKWRETLRSMSTFLNATLCCTSAKKPHSDLFGVRFLLLKANFYVGACFLLVQRKAKGCRR